MTYLLSPPGRGEDAAASLREQRWKGLRSETSRPEIAWKHEEARTGSGSKPKVVRRSASALPCAGRSW